MSGEQEPESPQKADETPGDRQVFDTSVAHTARVYDYWLGGKDNFAADRRPASGASRRIRAS